MKLRSLAVALALAAPLALGTSAQAVPISGGISFGGDGMPVGATDWAPSTGVHFIGGWTVNARVGDYLMVPAGFNPVAFTDFNWNGLNGPGLNVPLVQQIWTFTTPDGKVYWLNSDRITGVTRSPSPDGIIVAGEGTVGINDGLGTYSDTPATWNASFGTTGQAGIPNLSFSTDTRGVPGPEPLGLVLLGTGLLGLAARRRNRR